MNKLETTLVSCLVIASFDRDSCNSFLNGPRIYFNKLLV